MVTETKGNGYGCNMGGELGPNSTASTVPAACGGTGIGTFANVVGKFIGR
jgi:hypothetical protein